MAEILGLGLSHYPGLLVPIDQWSTMMARNVEVGRIPQHVFADRQRWPKAMREEWGGDEGLAAAETHKRRLVDGYSQMRKTLLAFQPDVVVIWGDDQYENFKTDCIPAFCVYIGDEFVSRPFGAASLPFKKKENVWGLAQDTEMRIMGHRKAARSLCDQLLGDGFDIAYAYTTRHTGGLAHSFNNTIIYLDYDRAGFPFPVIPVHVNCYGNQLMGATPDAARDHADYRSPPAPTPRRCFDIGRATARFFAASPWRVALVASSSWSHASLTAKHQRLYPDLPADRMRLGELERHDFDSWRDISGDVLEQAGQNEFLNWVCLAGAMSEAGQSPQIVDFVETHIFNSSKCFAIFPPKSSAPRSVGAR